MEFMCIVDRFLCINFMKNIEKLIKDYYVPVFIFLVGLILIVGPFMISNNLQGFDSPGHYASAYYIKNFFWPWPDGWNMMLLTGFPQGIFYPSLFHWLVAALSFVMPMIWAYKLIVVLAVIFFPVILFILAKKVFKENILASIVLALASIFYYFDLGLNDNLFCDLYFGMLPHLFSLTLFIFYLYFLFILVENRKKWILPAVFLTLIILTHAFTAFVAISFGIILWLFSFRDKILFYNIFWHLLVAALLSIFWWLPFILNISYMSGSDIGSEISPVLMIIIMPFVLGVSFVSLFIKNSSLFLKTIAVFNVFILLAFLIGRVITVDNFPIHFSRFLVYPLLLVPFSLIHVLGKKIDWPKLNFILLFVFIFYFFFFKIIPVGPFAINILDKVETHWQDARVVVSGGSRYLDDRFHATRMDLAMERNMMMSEGLFVESSANGWFIMSMMKSWEGTTPTFVWAYKELKSVADLQWGSKILGINYEYRLNDIAPIKEEAYLLENLEHRELEMQKKEVGKENYLEKDAVYQAQIFRNLKFKNNRERLLDDERIINILAGEDSPFYYQSFYQVGENSLAETVSVLPVLIENDWFNNNIRWWSTDWLGPEDEDIFDNNYDKPLLIYRHDPSDWQLAEDSIGLDVHFDKKKMDYFQVDASKLDQPAPIYIKISYFPFWKAFDERGEKIEIHKASPNFMMIYSRGVIDFHYLKPWYYYLSFIISALTILLLVIRAISIKKKMNNLSRNLNNIK
jgi:hypothetical protein